MNRNETDRLERQSQRERQRQRQRHTERERERKRERERERAKGGSESTLGASEEVIFFHKDQSINKKHDRLKGKVH